MGCFNSDKLQSINQFEGEIGPRPGEVLKYQQADNQNSYSITPYLAGKNCVYGLMYNAGDLNSAGGAEADSTTTLYVDISIDPNSYERISEAPTTIISPFATEDQLAQCAQDAEIECPTIPSQVNIGSLKARYILINNSQASVNSIVDNGYTDINNSRMLSTNIDGEYLVFVKRSFFSSSSIKAAYIFGEETPIGDSTLDAVIGAIFVKVTMNGGSMSMGGLTLHDSFISKVNISSLNGFICMASVVSSSISINEETTSNTTIPGLNIVANGLDYNNYECMPDTTIIDGNGQASCVKRISLTSRGPLRVAAQYVLNKQEDLLDDILLAVRPFRSDPVIATMISTRLIPSKIVLINSTISKDFTIQTNDTAFEALIVSTTFVACNATIPYIYSPKEQNNIISNVYHVTLTEGSELTSIQLVDLYIDNSSSANITLADKITNYGALTYKFLFLEEFVQDGSLATVNFTSESTALGGFNSPIRFNGGTVNFNRLDFRNLNNAPITDCQFKGGNISSRRGLIFTGCEVNIGTYEQKLNPTNNRPLNPLIIENQTIFKASLIESSIQNINSTVDVGVIYNHIGGITNKEKGLIKGNDINTVITNESQSIIEASDIFCREKSYLDADTYLIGKNKITCDYVDDIFCDMDAPTIVISGGAVYDSASLTGTINIVDSAVFAGTNDIDGEINFYESQLIGGDVYNANFYEDSQFFNGIMYDGTMHSGSLIGGKNRFTRPPGFPLPVVDVKISGEIEMNEATIDADITILNQSNIAIRECSAIGSSLRDQIYEITLKVFAQNNLEYNLTALSDDQSALDQASITFGCNNPTSSFTCLKENIGISTVDVSDSSLNMDFDVGSLNVNKSELRGCTIAVKNIAVLQTSITDCKIFAYSFSLDEDSELFASIVSVENSLSIKCRTANCTITSLQSTLNYEGTVEFPLDFSALSFDDTNSSLQSNNTTINGSSLEGTTITGPAVINNSYLQGCTLSQCAVNNSIIRNLSPLTDLDSCVFNNCTFLD